MATKSKRKSKPKTQSASLEVPLVCVKCRAPLPVDPMPGVAEIVREVPGMIDNFQYDQIRWIKKRCACGQVIATRIFSRHT